MKQLIILGLAALSLGITASAQTKTMRFDVPFQFVAGNESLPAGQYDVTVDEFSRMVIRPASGMGVHLVPLTSTYLTRAVDVIGDGRLLFTKYGDNLFLTAAWRPGYSDARMVTKSKRLQEAAKNNANGAPAESVELGQQ
jgi:hypothetical protein